MTSNAQRLCGGRSRGAIAVLSMALGACGGLRPMHATAPAAAAPSPVATPAPAAGAPAPAGPLAARERPSLYHRLGGYDAIAAFTDDFLGRATNDPVIGHFELERIGQRAVDERSRPAAAVSVEAGFGGVAISEELEPEEEIEEEEETVEEDSEDAVASSDEEQSEGQREGNGDGRRRRRRRWRGGR